MKVRGFVLLTAAATSVAMLESAAGVAADPVPGPYERLPVTVPGQRAAHVFPSDVSADGRYVAMTSLRERTFEQQASVWDRHVGKLIRVSVTPSGQWGNGDSTAADITPDGRFVLFTSWASDIVPGDTNDTGDVFRRDLRTGRTIRVSVSSRGRPGRRDQHAYGVGLNDSGRLTCFTSQARLVRTDRNDAYDVYCHNVATGRTALISRNNRGRPGDHGSHGGEVSASGRYVVFRSQATNLSRRDRRNDSDIFVHDRRTHRTQLASVRADNKSFRSGAYQPSMSGNGRHVGFSVSGRAYVRDRLGRKTTPVAVDVTGRVRSGDVRVPLHGGRVVLVVSGADLTGEEGADAPMDRDTYLVRPATGQTVRISGQSPPVEDTTVDVFGHLLTADRGVAIFRTLAQLTDDDTDELADVYLRTLAW